MKVVSLLLFSISCYPWKITTDPFKNISNTILCNTALSSISSMKHKDISLSK